MKERKNKQNLDNIHILQPNNKQISILFMHTYMGTFFKNNKPYNNSQKQK
jgi:hypothetical protein